MGHKQIAVLMGPTGSGKSALALEIAAARPTVIINADAMQMVGTLRVITARPTEQEEAQAEHALYGVLPPQEPTSVARWLALVEPVIRRAWSEGKLPLLVGGTGMYVNALKNGLASIPAIPDAVRERVRSLIPPPRGGRLGGGRLDTSSPAAAPPQPSPSGGGSIHARLQACDPIMAARLKPGDTQRILRALEVLEATGRSLAEWQAQKHQPVLPEAVFREFYIEVPKPLLYPRLDARFVAMMEQGALEEVRALMALDLPESNPITRAHGVPELAAYLRGEITREAAIAKAQQNTRNYAKRQQTWIRNQLGGATAIDMAALAGVPISSNRHVLNGLIG